MFVSSDLYEPTVRDIQCDDVQFWRMSLESAINIMENIQNEEADTKVIKLKTPAYFCTQMYNDDTVAYTRKQFNKNLRAQRRKSIVLDFDCVDEEEYKASRKLMIDFANDNNYYLLIYPTISYPEKPHFRAVFIVNRGLSAINYARAVSWLYKELGLAMTDDSDLDIRASRNLPVFIKQSQVDQIYSNLRDDCEKLDTKLWAKYKLDKDMQDKINKRLKLAGAEPIQLKDSVYYYDHDSLISAWSNHVLKNQEAYSKYDKVWKVLTSIAKAYMSKEINWSTVEELSSILASIDKEKQDEWNAGNLKLIEKFTNQDNLSEAKDLLQYDNSILMSMRTKNNGKEEEDNV